MYFKTYCWKFYFLSPIRRDVRNFCFCRFLLEIFRIFIHGKQKIRVWLSQPDCFVLGTFARVWFSKPNCFHLWLQFKIYVSYCGCTLTFVSNVLASLGCGLFYISITNVLHVILNFALKYFNRLCWHLPFALPPCRFIVVFVWVNETHAILSVRIVSLSIDYFLSGFLFRDYLSLLDRFSFGIRFPTRPTRDLLFLREDLRRFSGSATISSGKSFLVLFPN